jgi:hypothetical protein
MLQGSQVLLSCLTRMKANLVGPAWQNCNEAIRIGLPPPPGHVRRIAMVLKRSFDTLSRGYLVNTPGDTTSSITKSLFALSSRHIVLTWLFWFVVFTCFIGEARKAKAKVWGRSGRHKPNELVGLFISTCILTVTALVFVLIDNFQWVRREQDMASTIYWKYCESLPVRMYREK